MGQNASSWDKTISFLPDDIETVCPELSDFFVQGSCLYSKMYAAFCEYCLGFSDKLDLCGLSLGAVLALNFAIDFPQKVNSLILIAPQYDMPKFLLKVQNVLFTFLPASKFESIGFAKQDFISLTNSMAGIDLSGGLDKVTCCVKVLCGERDKANKRAAQTLAQKLKNAEYAVISGAGHEVNIDAPQKLAKAISEMNI